MNRRELLHLGAASALTTLAPAVGGAEPSESPAAVARFDLFEVSLHADTAGNPFRDVSLSAIFKLEHREIAVEGFCDGEATFRVRFMPDTEGAWTFRTLSNAPALDGRTGGFECVAARSGEHGPGEGAVKASREAVPGGSLQAYLGRHRVFLDWAGR